MSATGKTMRILVVDDDETFCRLLVEILEGLGMEAVWTTDPLVACEMSSRSSYDVFIIDVRMPVLLGTDLAEALKKQKPGANIILISSFPDEDLLTTSRDIGAPLLSKPFSAGRLLEAVEKVLSGSENQED
jgi:DNA-binding response OmpR family regulator